MTLLAAWELTAILQAPMSSLRSLQESHHPICLPGDTNFFFLLKKKSRLWQLREPATLAEAWSSVPCTCVRQCGAHTHIHRQTGTQRHVHAFFFFSLRKVWSSFERCISAPVLALNPWLLRQGWSHDYQQVTDCPGAFTPQRGTVERKLLCCTIKNNTQKFLERRTRMLPKHRLETTPALGWHGSLNHREEESK